MNVVRERLLHTIHGGDVPTETLKRKVLELEKNRKMRMSKSKDQFIVTVPESMSYLDTATLPMVLFAVGVAVFAKLLMMYDESRSQELLERKMMKAPDGQGSVRMLTREEWEKIRELRPRTPFESKLARPNARIRTREPLHLEDIKDWTIDVLMDATTRVEEYAKHGSQRCSCPKLNVSCPFLDVFFSFFQCFIQIISIMCSVVVARHE